MIVPVNSFKMFPCANTLRRQITGNYFCRYCMNSYRSFEQIKNLEYMLTILILHSLMMLAYAALILSTLRPSHICRYRTRASLNRNRDCQAETGLPRVICGNQQSREFINRRQHYKTCRLVVITGGRGNENRILSTETLWSSIV